MFGPKNIIFPDYKNSVVNVSASVLAALGGHPVYPVLKKLGFLAKSKKIVLMVIDGMGYEFLKQQGKDSFFACHCVDRITSTFPPTTVTAEISLETGVAPMQHGITGWTMYLKELGVVSKILLFETRAGGSLTQMGVKREDIYTEKLLFQKAGAPSVMVLPRVVTTRFCTDDWAAAFDDLNGFVEQTKIAAAKPGIRFVYSYWIELDHLCHKFGCSSDEAVGHFRDLDKRIAGLAGDLKDGGADLIITADHGLIDIPLENRIDLRAYPDIYDCLVLPLCGDSRAAFCYVKSGRAREFESLVKQKLGFCCVPRKSADLLKKGVFGNGAENPRLRDRIGDYILLAKKNYTIRDLLRNETKLNLKAHHGGTSNQEMYVPLIVSR